MKFTATGIGFIRVTLADGTKRLLSCGNLRSIEDGAVGRTITTHNAKNLQYEGVTETVAAIFAQQNTTNHHLGMLRVTETETGKVIIIFTHCIHKIVPYSNGTKSKIIFNANGKRTKLFMIADETLAGIMAQQGATKHLGLALVTKIDGQTRQQSQIIYNIAYWEYALADTTTVPGTNTRIVFDGVEKDIYVIETEAAIFAAQPT